MASKAAMPKSTGGNIVIDHTKFEARELLLFAWLMKMHRIITDKLPDDADLIQACEVAGIAIVVA